MDMDKLDWVVEDHYKEVAFRDLPPGFEAKIVKVFSSAMWEFEKTDDWVLTERSPVHLIGAEKRGDVIEMYLVGAAYYFDFNYILLPFEYSFLSDQGLYIGYAEADGPRLHVKHKNLYLPQDMLEKL